MCVMMTVPFELLAQPRLSLGKRPSRRLRRLESQIPVILYGKGGEPPLALSIAQNVVLRALENPAFSSHILTIKVGDITYQAVLKALQKHPFKPQVLHLDLLRVTATDRITLSVPLRFIGENIAPGVKQGGGIVTHLLTSVEVQCLPAQLPEFLEVDVSQLGLGETINLSQLKVAEGIELAALSHGDDRALVSIHSPRVQAGESSTVSTT